jgi:hypothetical protein
MNERAKEIFERAFALLDGRDALKADIERRDLELDADELVTRSAGPVRYRTQENALIEPRPKEDARPKPQRINDDDWNDWFTRNWHVLWSAEANKHIWEIVNMAGEIIADEVSKQDRRVVDKLREEIAELRREVEMLRKSANVMSLRGHRVA